GGVASWENVRLRNRSQKTERAREFARRPACSVNKLRFSQNEKDFSRTGSPLALARYASTPGVSARPLSVLIVVGHAVNPAFVRVRCSVRYNELQARTSLGSVRR